MIEIWCWWLLAVLPRIQSSSSQAQFLSLCSQTLNLSSLSMVFTPPESHSSCCNITFVKSLLSDSSEQITINILNMTRLSPSLRISTPPAEIIRFSNYVSSNRSYLKSDILRLPITFSLCQFNLPAFEILLTNISKGPCKPSQYRCSTNNEDQWCIDENYHCDGYHSCPQGMDEYGCAKSRSNAVQVKRTIRGGIVTTIIVFGLLLIIGSVSIALAFLYIRRKNQRRRQFTYSLESTSDDWEPSGTGYHLFDNWTNNRHHTGNNIDNVIIDANEHMPIATNMTNR